MKAPRGDNVQAARARGGLGHGEPRTRSNLGAFEPVCGEGFGEHEAQVPSKARAFACPGVDVPQVCVSLQVW